MEKIVTSDLQNTFDTIRQWNSTLQSLEIVANVVGNKKLEMN